MKKKTKKEDGQKGRPKVKLLIEQKKLPLRKKILRKKYQASCDNSRQQSDLSMVDESFWKDSFDKVVGDKSSLRKQKVIKRKICASFNRDSSFENSLNVTDRSIAFKKSDVKKCFKKKNEIFSNSTPINTKFKSSLNYLVTPIPKPFQQMYPRVVLNRTESFDLFRSYEMQKGIENTSKSGTVQMSNLNDLKQCDVSNNDESENKENSNVIKGNTIQSQSILSTISLSSYNESINPKSVSNISINSSADEIKSMKQLKTDTRPNVLELLSVIEQNINNTDNSKSICQFRKLNKTTQFIESMNESKSFFGFNTLDLQSDISKKSISDDDIVRVTSYNSTYDKRSKDVSRCINFNSSDRSRSKPNNHNTRSLSNSSEPNRLRLRSAMRTRSQSKDRIYSSNSRSSEINSSEPNRLQLEYALMTCQSEESDCSTNSINYPNRSEINSSEPIRLQSKTAMRTRSQSKDRIYSSNSRSSEINSSEPNRLQSEYALMTSQSEESDCSTNSINYPNRSEINSSEPIRLQSKTAMRTRSQSKDRISSTNSINYLNSSEINSSEPNPLQSEYALMTSQSEESDCSTNSINCPNRSEINSSRPIRLQSITAMRTKSQSKDSIYSTNSINYLNSSELYSQSQGRTYSSNSCSFQLSSSDSDRSFINFSIMTRSQIKQSKYSQNRSNCSKLNSEPYRLRSRSAIRTRSQSKDRISSSNSNSSEINSSEPIRLQSEYALMTSQSEKSDCSTNSINCLNRSEINSSEPNRLQSMCAIMTKNHRTQDRTNSSHSCSSQCSASDSDRSLPKTFNNLSIMTRSQLKKGNYSQNHSNLANSSNQSRITKGYVIATRSRLKENCSKLPQNHSSSSRIAISENDEPHTILSLDEHQTYNENILNRSLNQANKSINKSNNFITLRKRGNGKCVKICRDIDTIEISHNESSISSNLSIVMPPAIKRELKSGKWRKSIYLWKRETIVQSLENNTQLHTNRRKSCYNRMCEPILNKIPFSLDESAILIENSIDERNQTNSFVLEQTDVESTTPAEIPLPNEKHNILRHSVSYTSPKTIYPQFNETAALLRQSSHQYQGNRRRRTSVLDSPIIGAGPYIEELGVDFDQPLNARNIVLRRCGQSEPLDFDSVYSESALRQCHKIGEGVYGEVFMNKTSTGQAVVLKIIPIEGLQHINGEPQKRYDEIISEICIALELSSLRNGKDFMTNGFVEVIRVRCVQGRYPDHLIDLWELYRDNHFTDNDHPEIFTDDQLYIVFELANAGKDLEAFQFHNALQSQSAFQQTAITLAIAEKKYKFEHRDLHWGNILLSATDDKDVTFRLNGKSITIPTHGVKVTIIDYTLSRMVYENCLLYNDLSNDDELFSAGGDYQFDIYRLMKTRLDNQWTRFEPYTNVLWLHYTIDKMINGAHYKNPKTRKHRSAIHEMMTLRDELLDFQSSYEMIEDFNL